jgi:hypothetical protein
VLCASNIALDTQRSAFQVRTALDAGTDRMTASKELDQADARLRGSGFDPSAEPEQALETLRSLRARPDLSRAAIARALSGLRIAGAANLLVEMEREASGAERREIRRSLFKLRQRGIEPSRSEASPAKAVATAAPEPGLTAMLSPFDAEGTRLVWILKPRLQGGLSRLAGVTSDSEGLLGVRVGGLSRRELREERAELERRAGLKLIEIDWRLADFILCEAYQRTPPARGGKVGDFFASRAELIATPPPGDFVHPAYGELHAEPLEPSVELMREPEISQWKFPAEKIKPYVAQINELKESPLVLNKFQQQDRIEATVERALSELLSGEHGARVRRRLEDTAYYLARTGRQQPARWAAAAAAAIRDGADVKRIALFQNLIRLQLGARLAEEDSREQEQPRLIMTPAEAMRAQQSRARQR